MCQDDKDGDFAEVMMPAGETSLTADNLKDEDKYVVTVGGESIDKFKGELPKCLGSSGAKTFNSLRGGQ
jgi:hypothetical protein